MNLGEKLLKLRKEKGLSQEALAEQIKTTRQAISKCTEGAQSGRIIRAIRKRKAVAAVKYIRSVRGLSVKG